MHYHRNNIKNKFPSILIIGNFLSQKTGLVTACEDLSCRFVEMGWKVATTSKVQKRLLRLLDMVQTVFTQRRTYDIAIIDTYSGLAFIWAEVIGLTLFLLKMPYILVLHGGDLPKFSYNYPKRVSRLFGLAKNVITPSKYLYDKMMIYRNDIKIIPNSINLERYKYRLRYHLTPTLVWLRAFHNIYNPSLAPRTLFILKKMGIICKITMIGPDKGDGSLSEMIKISKKFDVYNQMIIIKGIPKNEVPKYLNKNDIFINTTNIDNTPVSLIEAMACGLCIVSTNVGGISYMLKDNMDALLVPPNNEEAMAQAIMRLLNEPQIAKKLSKNANTNAKKYRWDEIYFEWEKLITKE